MQRITGRKSRLFHFRVVFGLLLSASSLPFIATPQEPNQSISNSVTMAAATFKPSYFFGQTSLATGNSPNSVAAGDFNGDGALDLAVVNKCGSDSSCHSAGSVSILLRRPNGTFQQHVDYPTGFSPASPITGDFNKDGHLDLAVVNQGDDTVSIFLGNGDGTFQNERVYATGPQGNVCVCLPAVGALIAADFNRDGKLDLAVLLQAGISTLLGNGDGTFATHVDYQLNGGEVGIAAADFNGDGKLDLLAIDGGTWFNDFSNVYETIAVLRGNGDGTFQNPVNQQITTGNTIGTMIARDVNRDGKPDLITVTACDAECQPIPSYVMVLLGNGDGTFSQPPSYPFGMFEVGYGPGDVTAGDFNQDGNLDLAVSNPGNGNSDDSTTSILLGNGDGTFASGVKYGTAPGPSADVLGDFTGDGNLDLAVVLYNGALIMPGNGDGTFQGRFDSKVESIPVGCCNHPISVVTPDLNGDHQPDLAVAGSDNTVAILLGKGGGGFQSPVEYATGMSPSSVRAADFNVDGKTDLATVNSKDNTVSVLLGNGDGTLQPHLDYSTGSNPVALSARDLNGDGKPDLAVVNQNDNTVSILIGKGDGTFLQQVTYPTGKGPNSIFVGDFNGDGALDLAIANFSDNTVSILLANGDGSFKPHIDYGTAVNPVAVIAQDFNLDGKLDLAVATGAGVSVLLGNGNGTFQTHVDFLAGLNSLSLAARDFNSDGLPDLAVTNSGLFATPLNAGYGGVSILLNKGNGQFQPPVYIGSSAVSDDVVAGDLDGDGTPDLVVGNPPYTVSVLRNRPVIGLFPGHLSFGKEIIGTSSGARTVLLSNPSVPVLSLGKIAITGANAGDFSQTNSCTAQMKGGTSCQIEVTFTPKASGPRTAALTITDDAATKPQTIKLTGSGVK
jgi:hypothetical protein